MGRKKVETKGREVGRRRAKVLIVDDHPAIREALAIRIARTPDLEVCGEAEDLAGALRLVSAEEPDVAIVDISLKSGDGIDLIKHIRARRSRVRMLVWSMHGEAIYAERALRAGAHGYITKEQATDQIVDAVRQILSDQVYLSPTMTNTLLHRAVGAGGQPMKAAPLDVLSDRELEILRRIGQGQKTRAIAEELHLSVKTIETYRDRLRQKLDLRDGSELVRYALHWLLDHG
ncbi:MAG TPA: response regulator transcription factor [Pirellulales bacterium]|nr:response regulator transcription factor [Pirellulales bacterium]